MGEVHASTLRVYVIRFVVSRKERATVGRSWSKLECESLVDFSIEFFFAQFRTFLPIFVVGLGFVGPGFTFCNPVIHTPLYESLIIKVIFISFTALLVILTNTVLQSCGENVSLD